MSKEAELCMVHYYKAHILRLKMMLNDLDPNSSDFTDLRLLQSEIARLIITVEGRQSKKKLELKRLKGEISKSRDKQRSNSLKRKRNSVKRAIKGYRFLLYLLRCFGDGIVCKYVSRWNIKRFLYDVDTLDKKQPAGRLSGKSGFKAELKLLNSALDHNVPAILCDLTNIIRHGDLCLLGANDPFVVEVKSSGNVNARGERQLSSIGRIHDYLANDSGSFGEMGSIKRTVSSIDEVDYILEFNQMLSEVGAKGVASHSPEPGLYYIGFTGEGELEGVFQNIEEPMVFFLNPCKTEQAWDNYYPFVLSISNPYLFFDFIVNNFFLMTILDMSVLEGMVNGLGYKLIRVGGENRFIRLEKYVDGQPFHMEVTEHFAGRLGLEFMSLKWFVAHLDGMAKEMILELDYEKGAN